MVLGLCALALAIIFIATSSGDSPSGGRLDDGVSRPTRDEAGTDVRVVRIVDGDTLRVRLHGDSVRVRLLGIDAPEVAHDDSAAECFGDQATNELERLAPAGSLITLRQDSTQPTADRYGRLLRYVHRDGIDLGQQLLRRGAAERFRNRPPLEREREYDAAADRAKSEALGLWRSC